jgi:hypothetical protein
MWDKPKQVISKEEWKNISADSAPPGVYTSNMSDEDAGRWKGKVVGATLGAPQIELRKVFSGSYKQMPNERWGKGFCANVLVIVTTSGFKYKNVEREESEDYNVYMSMNGGFAMTFEELAEMQQAIEEARQKLNELAAQPAAAKPKKAKKK